MCVRNSVVEVLYKSGIEPITWLRLNEPKKQKTEPYRSVQVNMCNGNTCTSYYESGESAMQLHEGRIEELQTLAIKIESWMLGKAEMQELSSHCNQFRWSRYRSVDEIIGLSFTFQ